MAPREPVVDVLVTGASGFLGSNTVKSLLKKHPEWRISTLDVNPASPEITPHLYKNFTADVSDYASVQRVFQDYVPTLVVHSAGIVPAREKRYSTKPSDWERVKAINYTGTRHVLDASLAAGCRKFVYTSSCTCIIDDLDHDYFYVDEKLPVGRATLHYGKSKAMAELYVLDPVRAEETGLEACALRPTTIIGEGDTAVVGVFHDLIRKGETGFIVGDGDNLYDFMYIDNAVLAHVLAIENLLTTGTAKGHAFFVSNQEPVYFWDFMAAIWAEFGHVPRFRVRIPLGLAWFVALLLEIITWVTGASSTLDTGSVKDGVRTHYANNNKAIEILGYRPTVGLAEGVRRACRDYKQRLALDAKSKRSIS